MIGRYGHVQPVSSVPLDGVGTDLADVLMRIRTSAGVTQIFPSPMLPESAADHNGNHYDADVIVFATGFKPLNVTNEIDVTGIDGLPLADAWDEITFSMLETASRARLTAKAVHHGGVTKQALTSAFGPARVPSFASLWPNLPWMVSRSSVRSEVVVRVPDWLWDAANPVHQWSDQPEIPEASLQSGDGEAAMSYFDEALLLD